MDTKEPLVLELQEGPFINYISTFHKHFGGELKSDSYYYKQGNIELIGSITEIANNIELSVSEVTHPDGIKLLRLPDNNPEFLHLIVVHTGHYTLEYDNQLQHLEAESTKGIFFYNGLFPLTGDFPAKVPHKAISIKFEKKALIKLIPEIEPLLNRMYSTTEGLAYHISPPHQVYKLVDDILQYHRGGFAAKALLKARGLEILAVIMKMLEQMKDDDLNGLHIDDYKRLMQIKKRLLNSLTDSINVESIAEEFAISSSKLNRDFKSLFNMSIYKFYTHSKMEEAYRRLLSGKYTVTEVSYDLGYNTLSKFSEMFKKIKGVNPKKVIPTK
ncbi:helix-turn-helix domain-containing protein [Saccharicrinis aurantiacus]|uniref:helix-turn-helix domain-containing protein n=1 Tax=Saccharicrinis aurantiacus TaxID=1849719 RepID=UPI0009502A3D|nr:AraC family transcriptional regulator [Saccharicrinis aurantiacus]